LVKAKALADEYGALFGLHASETAQEVADVRARTGFSPVRLLDNLALLGPNVLLFHGVHLDDEEIELLAGAGAGVAHCPEANLKLASGIARLPALLGGGVRVGLGTDGPASNNDFNMWGEIQTAAKIHRGAGQDMMATSAKQIVYMATRAGADLLGLGDEIGALEPGKRADIILIDLDQPHLVPMYDVYSHLAYAVGRSDVTTTIINGRLVMRNRRLLTLDEDEVVGNAREVSRQISQWLAGR
jgi:5-methylthioadenosine/S-adenosylhomocysteine deaminase